jgi:hypothetical protein
MQTAGNVLKSYAGDLLKNGVYKVANLYCTCPRKCIRHGKCKECRAFKKKKKMLPHCERKKKSKA